MKLTVFVSLLLVFIIMDADHALSEPIDPQSPSDTIATEDYPERFPSHSTWEKIASAPGKLFYLPFHIILKSIDLVTGISFEVPLVMELADFMVADDGSRGLIPTYASRSGGGLKFYQKGLISDQSKLDLAATAGLRWRQRYRFRIRRIDIADGAMEAGLKAQYTLMPDEPFYGIGMSSNTNDETNFAFEQVIAELSLGKRFGERVASNAVIIFERNSILKGKDDSTPSTTVQYDNTLPGLETGVEMFGGGLSIHYDSKNHPGKPTGGWDITLSGKALRQTGDDRYGFWAATIDIARHLHLFYGRYLVVRFAARKSEPLSDREIPFYYMSEIGRTETIRGVKRGRFRDHDSMIGSTEYRYPIMARNLDAFVFVDAGQVTPDIFDHISGNDFEVTFGGGIRIWKQDGNLLTVQIGKSREFTRLHLDLN